MPLSAAEHEIKTRRREWEKGFNLYKQVAYDLASDSDLSTADLQSVVGDTLPTDATHEIIEATVEQNPKGGRVAVVVGLKEIVEAAGTPWSELTGARQVIDKDPNYIDYVISFTGATNAARPSGGDTYSDVTGAGSISSTGLDTEPAAIEISDKKYVTVNKSHVTVRFRGHYAYV